MAICLWPTGVNGFKKYLGRHSVAFVQIFFNDYIVGILASPTLSSNVNNIVSFHSDQAQIMESKILKLRRI